MKHFYVDLYDKIHPVVWAEVLVLWPDTALSPTNTGSAAKMPPHSYSKPAAHCFFIVPTCVGVAVWSMQSGLKPSRNRNRNRNQALAHRSQGAEPFNAGVNRRTLNSTE